MEELVEKVQPVGSVLGFVSILHQKFVEVLVSKNYNHCQVGTESQLDDVAILVSKLQQTAMDLAGKCHVGDVAEYRPSCGPGKGLKATLDSLQEKKSRNEYKTHRQHWVQEEINV